MHLDSLVNDWRRANAEAHHFKHVVASPLLFTRKRNQYTHLLAAIAFSLAVRNKYTPIHCWDRTTSTIRFVRQKDRQVVRRSAHGFCTFSCHSFPGSELLVLRRLNRDSVIRESWVAEWKMNAKAIRIWRAQM